MALGSAGCAPIVEPAPFPARADTRTAGDLLGPYDGLVIDAETERPIAGATVTASWAFERGRRARGPVGAYEFVTETGADGRYRIPPLKDLPKGVSVRVARFTLVVYHRGHVGWRSDHLFPAGAQRRDFSQRGNRVRLDPWKPTYLHHRHLVFLGGGPAIRAAAAWEVQPASLELDAGGVVVSQIPAETGSAGLQKTKLFDASSLLSEDEVRGVTGYAGRFEITKLGDLPTTEFYDSRHFKAAGKPESHDVGLRVWRLGSAGAEAQYGKVVGDLPTPAASNEIGDASVRAQEGEVMGLSFLARNRGVVVTLTCGRAQCPDASVLLKLAKLVESHIADLPEGAK